MQASPDLKLVSGQFAGWSGTNCVDAVPTTPNTIDINNLNADVTCEAAYSRPTVVVSVGVGGIMALSTAFVSVKITKAQQLPSSFNAKR